MKEFGGKGTIFWRLADFRLVGRDLRMSSRGSQFRGSADLGPCCEADFDNISKLC